MNTDKPLSMYDSLNVQAFLMWFLGIEMFPGRPITDAEAKEAALHLTRRSCRLVGFKVTVDELQRRWPSADPGACPSVPPFVPASAVGDAPMAAYTHGYLPSTN